MTENRIVIRTTAGETGSAENSEWTAIIREANRITWDTAKGAIFTDPMSTGGWWAGGYVENYADARLILPAPDSGREYSEGALISSTTERGFQVLSQVVKQLGITTARTITSVVFDENAQD